MFWNSGIETKESKLALYQKKNILNGTQPEERRRLKTNHSPLSGLTPVTTPSRPY